MNETPYRGKYQRLQKLAGALRGQIPGPMGGFTKLRLESLSAGALDQKTKELIALAIAISARCEGCVAYHVHDSLRAGASRQELLETIGVALMMGGGPALIYGCEALDALDQFTQAAAAA